MRLTLQHARALTLELLRYPTFSVPTLAFQRGINKTETFDGAQNG